MGKLSDQTRDKLKKISTATLTTALFKRGFMHQMIQDVHPLNPQALPMVGEAFTLRYIPAREDLNKITVFADRRAAHLELLADLALGNHRAGRKAPCDDHFLDCAVSDIGQRLRLPLLAFRFAAAQRHEVDPPVRCLCTRSRCEAQLAQGRRRQHNS